LIFVVENVVAFGIRIYLYGLENAVYELTNNAINAIAMVIASLLVAGLWEYLAHGKKKDKLASKHYAAAVKSNHQNGGQTIGSVGRDAIQQIFQPGSIPVPVHTASFPLLDASKISIVRITPQLDYRGHQANFMYSVVNDTDFVLLDCAVYLNEVAFRKRNKKKWQIADGLLSSSSLRWKDRANREGKLRIAEGERREFQLAGSHTFDGKNYRTYFTFYDAGIEHRLQSRHDYRILVSFHANPLISSNVAQVKYHIFLAEKEQGKWEHKDIIRISNRAT